MASQDPVKVDEKELQKAEDMWLSFGVWSKAGIICTIALLILLAVLTL